jgi:RNA polymerase sigma-70 factor (ECF subfamily)
MPDYSKEALDRMAPEVHSELRRLARHYLTGERNGHTLQPTALVHEAYLRLTSQRSVDWCNRAQFVALAASMMRRILVNHARKRNAAKRDSDAAPLLVDTSARFGVMSSVDMVDLSRALDRLGELDEQQEKIVELRFFGGLSIEETAEALGVGASTVKRDWATARLFLMRELSSQGPV